MNENENIFSINMLMTGIMSKSLDHEKYIIESEFGNKVIKGSIVPPDVSKTVLGDIRKIKHQIEENNVLINKLRKKLPVTDLSLSEIAERLISSEMLSGTLLKIDEGKTEIQTSDGKIIIMEGGGS
jgi:hypothetical protein